jgi:serine/threonine protein kinase
MHIPPTAPARLPEAIVRHGMWRVRLCIGPNMDRITLNLLIPSHQVGNKEFAYYPIRILPNSNAIPICLYQVLEKTISNDKSCQNKRFPSVFVWTDRVVAVKEHPINRQSQWKQSCQWMTEVSVMQMVAKHENLMGAEVAMFDGRTVYIVMPYYSNGDLWEFINHQHFIENCNMAESQVRKIFYTIVQAVQSLHSLGVCHRYVVIVFCWENPILVIFLTFFCFQQHIHQSKIFLGTYLQRTFF